MIHVLAVKAGYAEDGSVSTVIVGSKKGFATTELAITDLANFLFKSWSLRYKLAVEPHPKCAARHHLVDNQWSEDFIDYVDDMGKWTADFGPQWGDNPEHDWWPWDGIHFWQKFKPHEIVEITDNAGVICFEALTNLPEAYAASRYNDVERESGSSYFTADSLKDHITVGKPEVATYYKLVEADGKIFVIGRVSDVGEGDSVTTLSDHADFILDASSGEMIKNRFGDIT